MQKSSAPQQSKLKVTYGSPDFSAFFVENLIRGLGLSGIVQVKRSPISGSDELKSSKY